MWQGSSKKQSKISVLHGKPKYYIDSLAQGRALRVSDFWHQAATCMFTVQRPIIVLEHSWLWTSSHLAETSTSVLAEEELMPMQLGSLTFRSSYLVF